jgi:hypothetical protein
MLGRIRDEDKSKAQKPLHIVIAAQRPLTLEEMGIALAIEDDDKCYNDLDLENERRLEFSVRNVCGLFITIVDQKIYLIHQTAKDSLSLRTRYVRAARSTRFSQQSLILS